MPNKFRVDASDAAPTPAGIARLLFGKAGEYLDALRLETGLKVEPSELRSLQVALLEDFVEVHNAALRRHVHLPETKNDLDKLIAP